MREDQGLELKRSEESRSEGLQRQMGTFGWCSGEPRRSCKQSQVTQAEVSSTRCLKTLGSPLYSLLKVALGVIFIGFLGNRVWQRASPECVPRQSVQGKAVPTGSPLRGHLHRQGSPHLSDCRCCSLLCRTSPLSLSWGGQWHLCES